MSAKDMDLGFEGYRPMVEDKDMVMGFKCSPVRDNHIIKMVDVDYYVDLLYWLSFGRPVIIYTFQPSAVAGMTDDASFTIKDDVVHFSVSGGARWQHRVWDYSADCVYVPSYWNSLYSYVCFCESIQVSHDRRIVGLFPRTKMFSPMESFREINPLQRMRYTYGRFNVLRVENKGKVHYSIGYNGSAVSVDINADDFEATRIRLENSKKPVISDVERILRASSHPQPVLAAAILKEFLDKTPQLPRQRVVSVGQPKNERGYQSLTPLVTEDGKNKVKEIRGAICKGAVHPVSSYNNDVRCVDKRIVAVANNTVFPQRYQRYACAFVKLLIPSDQVERGFPLALSDVFDRQDRPSQRAGFEQNHTTFFSTDNRIKAFQKSEAYANVNDPRNISTTTVDSRVRYSSFTLPLAEHIKKFEWYAFGRTPKVWTEMFHVMASNSEWILATDYSRFDGTISKSFHTLLRLPILRRFFSPEYHPEVLKLAEQQRNCPASTAHGVTYNSGYGTVSGSADTSLFNTIFNAFVAFVSICETRMRSLSCDMAMTGKPFMELVEGAFEELERSCLFGGDDGILCDCEAGELESAAEKMGLKLKLDVYHYGPVPFLGRWFVNPWVSGECMADVQRQVRKFGLTGSNLEEKKALVAKALGYLATDTNTPLISHWSRAIIRACGDLQVQPESWWARMANPDEVVFQTSDSDEAKALAAEGCGIQVSELDEICDIIDGWNDLDQFELLLDLDAEVKYPVVLDGSVVGEVEETVSITSDNTSRDSEISSTRDSLKTSQSAPVRRRPSRRKSQSNPVRSDTTVGDRVVIASTRVEPTALGAGPAEPVNSAKLVERAKFSSGPE
nr:hypothetical protein 1 [Beihai noda-like virus 5]